MASAERYGQAFAYESITVSTSAVGLTASKIVPTSGPLRPAFEAFLTLEPTNGIRYRLDGTDPTDTEGHPLAGGGTVTITGTNNLKNFRMIRSGGADATVKVTYFR